MTTYRGFRIHQGKKGCTPKGNPIPKKEQYDEKYQWEVEDDRRRLQPATKRVVKKEYLQESPSMNVCTSSATTTAPVKEEYNYFAPYLLDRGTRSRAGHELQEVSTLPQVKPSVREHPTPRYSGAVVRPKEKKRQRPPSSQIFDSGAINRSWCSDNYSDQKQIAATMKEEPTSSSVRGTNLKVKRQLLDFYNLQQMGRRKPALPPKPQIKQEKLTVRAAEGACQNVTDSTSTKTEKNYAAAEPAANEEDKSPNEIAEPHFSVKELAQRFSANTAAEKAVQPKKYHREEPKQSQAVPNPRSAVDQIVPAAKTTEDPEASCESAQLPDSTTGIKVKKLAQMFTAQETAVRPKKKHKEEPKQSKVKLQVQTFSTAPVQGAAAAPREENRKDQNPSQVPDPRSAVDQISPAAKTTEDPKASCESAQLPDSTPGIKEKKLAHMFTAQETAVRPKKKNKEEPKLPEDRTKDDLKQKIQMTEEKMAICTSAVRVCKPCQGSLDLDAVWPEIDGVFSEVMKTVEGAKQKSVVLPLPSLRATTITMIKQIQQKLDKLTSIELKCISKFAVDVKLDPNTAHRCLVSADGMKVSGDNQEACDTPGSFGSVLGLESLVNGRFYWEVEVSNKTGWDLGVARGDANRKGKLAVKTDYGFWVTAHYENQEYAALTAPPVCLYLKDKPEKVGVFVDFEECLVSFYNVTAQSHIYSFTECLFAGEIFPYFSVHQRQDGSNADPLTISPVKRQ
ncbi:hypothetical protein Q5P01_002448 [Channa striata]|uniref:B30.2/SPRY domain-containing protein n=1 Tax=Channa striata TaxID=64152 RepID=A0AA88NP88_CHASR|nr:hypothetical protein Q5P01_002448 [Channa striata]